VSQISYSYALAHPSRVQQRGRSRAHVVRREHWTPGMSPVAGKAALCGARAGAFTPGRPGETSCPDCRRELARITADAAARITDPDLVLCPDGCTRPDGLPVLCDPLYDSPDGDSPVATGAFRCPLCRREHTPLRTGEHGHVS
jgi:hypothetical protein